MLAPAEGDGVVTEITREDGSTTLIRLESTDDGRVVRFLDGEVIHEVAPEPGYIAAGRPECAAGAYSLMGHRWNQTLRWRLNFGSRPSYLSANAVEGAMRRAMQNITQQFNHCGMADRVGARGLFDGSTSRRAGINNAGTCVQNDGVNVVSFGALPSGTLAVACTYYSNGIAKNSDLKFNKSYSWYAGASPPAGCNNQFSLRAVATHERGHSFGLGHVSEASFPFLTMSTSIKPCTNSASSLGRGDIRGLRRLY